MKVKILIPTDNAHGKRVGLHPLVLCHLDLLMKIWKMKVWMMDRMMTLLKQKTCL